MTKTPRGFYKPLAIGAPTPYRELPARVERMLHFVPPHLEKVRAKIGETLKEVDVIVGNLEDAIPAEHKDAARKGFIEMALAHDFAAAGVGLWTRINCLNSPWHFDDVTQIEIAMQQAAEIEKRGDSVAAWEAIEAVARNSPEDSKLNQYLANLTIKSAAFVNVLKSAEEYEKTDRLACALTAYLAAQKLYPYRQFAKDGILRIVKQIHPDAQ